MRLRAFGDLYTVNSIEATCELNKYFFSKNIIPRIIGWGANQLLPESSNVPYVNLDFSFDESYLNSPRDEYQLPASVSLSKLSSHAVKNGLRGWEVFTGIPASLGGAIFMNAGTNLGEIKNIVKEVEVVKYSGKRVRITVDENSFGYRKNNFLEVGDIIVGATLIHHGQDPAISEKIKEYLALRNRTQPLKEKTCGCIFKNNGTCRAGQFIDIMGLKGFTVNGIQISPKHANFMVNLDNACQEDVVEAIGVVQDELYLQFGVSFETEVKLD